MEVYRYLEILYPPRFAADIGRAVGRGIQRVDTQPAGRRLGNILCARVWKPYGDTRSCYRQRHPSFFSTPIISSTFSIVHSASGIFSASAIRLATSSTVLRPCSTTSDGCKLVIFIATIGVRPVVTCVNTMARWLVIPYSLISSLYESSVIAFTESTTVYPYNSIFS